MKPPPRACSIVLSRGSGLGLALLSAAVASLGHAAAADAPTAARTSNTAWGRVLDFTRADHVLTTDLEVPAAGWAPGPAAFFVPFDPRGPARLEILWMRLRFDRAELDREPLAFYTEDDSNRIQVYLNGVEIYRDFSAPEEPVTDANAAALSPLPKGLVRGGSNELDVAILSRTGIGARAFAVGSNEALKRRYDARSLWKSDVPRKLNFTMLMMAYASMLFWLLARRESIFPLYAAASFAWTTTNTSYIFGAMPLGEVATYYVSAYGLLIASAMIFFFCISFIGRQSLARIGWIGLALGAGALWAAQAIGPPGSLPLLSQGLSLAFFALIGLIAAWVWRRTRSAEPMVVWILALVLVVGSLHDLGRAPTLKLWPGLGFDLHPYLGFVICAAFLASFGRRAAASMRSLERLNQSLEARIRQAQAELAESEARRRELEVLRAVEVERERLLREMHDGIGSNLVTALKIAEKQRQPPSTIATLRRAVSDLRITVDSLEPFDGDLVALLGNLRHRLDPDLRDAGVACRWRVADCARLPWLDAANALHVLRIFQEAVGNVLAHARASEIEIGCAPLVRAGRPGVEAYVQDNGLGFDPGSGNGGKGLRNMRSRARALMGDLTCRSAPGQGARIEIWLPYERGAAVVASAPPSG